MREREIIDCAAQFQNHSDFIGAEGALRAGLAAYPNSPCLSAALGHLLCLLTREQEAIELCSVAVGCEEGRALTRILAHYYHLRNLAAERLKRNEPDAKAALNALVALAKKHEISLAPWPPLTLSAVMIVKNESADLADCLSSIKPICDEIIVVDTGSDDDTVAIAKRAGAVVGRFAWNGSFADARNFALKLAKSQWVLWIDADERLTQESYGAILAAMVRPHFGGYMIAIENYLHETDERQDVLLHHTCRLFQKLDGIAFEGAIHEQIAPSIVRMKLPMGTLEGALIKHYGYRASQMAARGKHERNIKMLREELRKNPNDKFHWFNLGNALSVARNPAEAIECLKKAVVDIDPMADHAQLAHQLIALAYIDLGDFQRAIESCQQSIADGFDGHLIQYAKAYAEFKDGDHRSALKSIRKSLSQKLRPNEVGDRTIGEYKARYLEAQILTSLGDFLEAEIGYREVLETVPTFAPAKLSLAVLLRELNQTEQAYEWSRSISTEGEIGRIANDLAVMCAIDLGRTEEAVEIREEYWKKEPSSIERWQKWVQTCEKVEDWDAAVRAYGEYVQSFEPTASILINAGRALANTGNYQVALTCFEDAAAMDPTDANAYFNAGDLLYRAGNYKEAAQAYSAGISQDIQNPQAWFVFGNSLWKIGLYEAACSAFEQTLALDTNHSDAAANLKTARELLLEQAS